MERLTKEQKEILAYLKDANPRIVSLSELNCNIESERRYKKGVVLIEIKILEEKGLVKSNFYTHMNNKNKVAIDPGSYYFTISSKGIDKVRENFITRILDAAYDNPLKAVSVIITLILGILGLIITLWK